MATPSSGIETTTAVQREVEQVCGSAMRTVLLLALIAFLTWMALHQWDPPKPRPANAPATEFSAERAMTHVRQLAREPHWVGTPAHEAARDYVVSQLAALGGKPEVEKAVAVWSRGGNVFAGSVQNVVARFPGSANTHPLLLMAHYDSSEHAPGAADDASGTATILEAVRALQTGPPLRNDLIVLITDGEEAGLLGAEAFVHEHPWAKDVGLVINFEARGTEGPALLFETSNDNGWLMREMAKAAPGVAGSSLMYSIYKRLPNDTDLTVTRHAGLPGLNFAFIDGFENYHMRNDSPARMSPRTLQQEGEYALRLARHFGNVALPGPRTPEAVFFNISGKMVTYPAAWSRGIAIAVLVVFIALLPAIFASGKLQPGTLASAILGVIATGMASVAVAWLAWRFIRDAVAGQMQLGATPSNEHLLLAVALSSGLVVALGYALLQRWAGWRTAAVASAGVAAGLSVLVAIALPAGAYLFTWPAAAVVATLAVLLFAAPSQARKSGSPDTPSSETPVSSGGSLWLAVAVVGAIPAIFFLAPMACMFLVGMSLGPVSVVATGFLAWVGAMMAAPLVLAVQARRLWLAPTIVLLAAAACFSVGKQQAGFSAEHPRRDSLFYGIDADQKQAQLLSVDARTDPWTERFLGKNPRRGPQPTLLPGVNMPVMSADAPLLEWAAPQVEVLDDSTSEGSRVLKLRVAPGRVAQILRIRSDGAQISSVAINGVAERLERPGKLTLSYAAPPAEGIDLAVQAAPGPLSLQVAAISIGLPQLPGFPEPRLPDDVVAQYHSYMSVVTKKFTF